MQADKKAASQQQQQQADQLKVLQDHNSSLAQQLVLLQSNLADAAGRQDQVSAQYQLRVVPHRNCLFSLAVYGASA